VIHGKPTSGRSIVSAVIFILIGFVFACIWIWPTNSFWYNGMAVDSDGKLYIGERLWIGVYENGERIDRLTQNNTGAYYEFTIADDQIHLWDGTWHHKVRGLDGSKLREECIIHNNDGLSIQEKHEFTAEDGRFYKLDNGLLKRAKVTCYHPDGSQETVFQMPLGLYLTKLAFFVYLPSLAVWIIRQWHMNSKKQGSGKA